MIRLIRPEYKKVNNTNLLFSCVYCKASVKRPGVDNKFCSDHCKKKILEFSFKRAGKKSRKIKKNKKKLIKKTHPFIGTSKFYESREWQELRYKTIIKYGRKCMCCFVTNVELHVDHIKPISKFPELALTPNNLQVLCRPCNKGKSNKDMSDLRPDYFKE